MKTEKLLKYLLLSTAVILFSCRNTREIVKTESSAKTESEIVLNEKEEVKTSTKTESAIAENVLEVDSTVIEETIITYSKPDSTGQQYAETVTIKKIQNGKSKLAETVESSKTNQMIDNKNAKSEKETSGQSSNTETKSKETAKPSIPWKFIGIGFVFALFIGLYFVVRKFIIR